LDNDNLKSCDVVSGIGCITDEEKKELVKEKGYEEKIFDKSCTICRLFGSPYLGSKVFIKDLTVDKATFQNIEVRDFVAIDRDTLTAKEGGKFDAEVVPAGTQFDLEIVVENPVPYELGLLCAGFELFTDGQTRIGGMTSRGLGRVEITINENIKEIKPENILQKEDQSKKFSGLRETWDEALTKKINGGE
jgi:CRISPR-associated RAMP protein (TIGR02581 family)